MDEQLKTGKNPPGLDATFDLVASFANDPERAERYPQGTTFIAADLPEAPKLMARAVEEKRPFTVIYPDGSDWLARPPEGAKILLLALGLLLLLDWRGRRREALSDDPLYVPRGWTVEYRAAAREPALT